MNSVIADQLNKGEPVKASDSASWLLSHGISSVTTDDLASLLGIPKTHVPQRMSALKKRHEIVTPAQGLWIPVPLEYLTWGAPPAIEIIDSIMRHMNVEYYVGWLSATEMHGASHHAPQVFQVATSRTIRERVVGRSHFQYYSRAHLRQVSLIQMESRSGMVQVSSRETTLLDVANDIGIVGGIDNAANIIIELCEDSELNLYAIAALSVHYPVTAARRLGFLMERFLDISGLELIRNTCLKRNAAVSLLDPQSRHSGVFDTRWNIKINREVSPDI